MGQLEFNQSQRSSGSNIHPPSAENKDSSRNGAGQLPWNGDMVELDMLDKICRLINKSNAKAFQPTRCNERTPVNAGVEVESIGVSDSIPQWRQSALDPRHPNPKYVCRNRHEFMVVMFQMIESVRFALVPSRRGRHWLALATEACSQCGRTTQEMLQESRSRAKKERPIE